ncbi:hypothetical protein [Granulicoccus sp. GXG6511]|uniref:hypothetical protein n=1 Tax=Granulicoccus sp. GXG6511 TaxID=3381351 RepID=UPI003D7EA9F1
MEPIARLSEQPATELDIQTVRPAGRSPLLETPRQAWTALRMWGRRQILVAVFASVAIALLIGAATVMFPNPVFGREVPTVWWNYPVWLLASVLSGMLVATYVRRPGGTQVPADPAAERAERRSGRLGMAGGVLAWFAVGCPVCNKIVLLALGSAGAMTWFAPVQPFMGLIALAMAGVALVWSLKGQVACPAPKRPGSIAG